MNGPDESLYNSRNKRSQSRKLGKRVGKGCSYATTSIAFELCVALSAPYDVSVSTYLLACCLFHAITLNKLKHFERNFHVSQIAPKL